ncbi:MAG: hypothetical protein E6Q40_15665 [Cupriavidus sp.]|nr:MAG: hypothetical protein E6Q40_15665 [Cupriavidus sp.]
MTKKRDLMTSTATKTHLESNATSLRLVRACLEGTDDNALRALVQSVSQAREAVLLKTLNYAIETRVFSSGAKKVAKVFLVPFLVRAQGVADLSVLDASAISATTCQKISDACGASERDVTMLHSRLLPLETLRKMTPRQMYELAGLVSSGAASERGVIRLLRDNQDRVEDNWLMVDGSYYFMGAMVGAFIGNQGRSKFTLGSDLQHLASERVSRYTSLLLEMLLEAQAPELGDLTVRAIAPHGLCSGIPAASLLLCKSYAQAIMASGVDGAQVCLSAPSGNAGGKLELKFTRPDGAAESLAYPWSVYDQRHQWEIATAIQNQLHDLGSACAGPVAICDQGSPIVRH